MMVVGQCDKADYQYFCKNSLSVKTAYFLLEYIIMCNCENFRFAKNYI